MGFYGNITNTSRTQFYFDKIYPNRKTMEDNCNRDGVYVGRYVLIEYDEEMSKDTYNSKLYCVEGKMYIGVDKIGTYFNGVLKDNLVTEEKTGTIIIIKPGNHYYDINQSTIYIRYSETGEKIPCTKDEYDEFIRVNNIQKDSSSFIVNNELIYPDWYLIKESTEFQYKNPIFKIEAGHAYQQNKKEEYWVCEGADSVTGELIWRQIANIIVDKSTISEENVAIYRDSSFLSNFQWDIQFYGSGRGYDSTVWQKVYTNGIEKYVMIAELNTIVPVFDIVPDAPTLYPIGPHFDKDTTNVYYKLHWQPQWGFRIKSATPGLRGYKMNNNGKNNPDSNRVLMSTDTRVYPSDVEISWEGKTYNIETGDYENIFYNPYYQKWSTETDIKETIDKLTEVGSGIPESIYEKKLDGAIYFNKEGLSPEFSTHSKDLKVLEKYKNVYLKDQILLEPSGISGNLYNSHAHSLDRNPQPDIQELSIILPSIGDTIADVWDLVYGNFEQNKSRQRNLNLGWESAHRVPARAGLRLISPSYFKNTLTENKVNTIAGSINSVLDLIGMIIVNDKYVTNPNQTLYLHPETLDSNLIYYKNEDNKFYRRKEDYEYIPVDYIYRQIEMTEEIYAPYKYYHGNNREIAIETQFDPTKTYWEKVLVTNSDYTLKNLIPYKPSYLRSVTPLYSPDDATKQNPHYEYYFTNEVQDQTGITYYNILNKTKVELSYGYAPYSMYYSVDNNEVPSSIGKDFLIDENGFSTPGRQYYTVADIIKANNNMDFTQTYHEDTGFYGDGNVPLMYLYYPGVFYYSVKDENGKVIQYVKEVMPIEEWTKKFYTQKNDTVDNKEYLILDQESRDLEPDSEFMQEINGVMVPVPIINAVRVKGIYKVKLIPFVENKYYYPQGTCNIFDDFGMPLIKKYKLLTLDDLYSHYQNQFTILKENEETQSIFIDYYTIKFVEVKSFYERNKYWYETEYGDFIIDSSDSITKGRVYYSEIVDTPLNSSGKEIYIPGKYYYLDPITNAYVIDYNNTMTSGREYYHKGDLYVIEDIKKQYPLYGIWNPEVTSIPASITLATRREKTSLVEIPGLARDFNTILGSILKINSMLEIGDTKTRDLSKVQGCINQMQDIIAKFDKLTPRSLTIIDDYGRLHGSDWSTSQNDIITNWRKNITTNIDSQENRWIYLTINSDSVNPKIYLRHKFNKVDDTTSTVNKNSDGTNILTLYSPIVDSMGHVVGKNLETVTLPYSFKKFNIGTQSTSKTNLTSNTTAIEADSITDTITFTTGNKWIKMAGTADSNTITVGHEVNTFSSGTANTWYGLTSNETISTLDIDNTFEVPRFIFDEAGHITGAETHTVIIPESFKTITIKNTGANAVTESSNSTATFTATTLEDGFTLDIDNRWITLQSNTTNKTVSIGHSKPGNATTSKGEGAGKTLNYGNSFKVLSAGIDNTGHVNTLNEYQITLPTLTLNAGTGNVVTQIALTNSSTGVFTETRANVGTLALTGYTLEESSEDIIATDSINSAFSKIQQQLKLQTPLLKTFNYEIDSAEDFNDKDKTIEWLFKKVASLEEELNKLKPTEEEPSEEIIPTE